jgi:rhodanese-related sulfurtransferase
MQSWINELKEIETVQSISVQEFADIEQKNPTIAILDVRKHSEYDSEHIVSAENFPLDTINEDYHQINKEKEFFVHCAGGYRSMIFISILKARGYHHLINIDGGFNAIKESKAFSLTEFVCPTTLL